MAPPAAFSQHNYYASNNGSFGDGMMTDHERQMSAFYYTCFILLFYAILILYFMLRTICKQQTRTSYQSIYCHKHLNGDNRLLEEREMRSNIKKQLCMHLIKMGQLTGSIVDRAPYADSGQHKSRPCHQSSQTDLAFGGIGCDTYVRYSDETSDNQSDSIFL